MYWQILLLFLLLCYNLIARECVKSEWMLFPWQRNPWISPFDELIGWKTMNLLSSCYTFAFTVITWVCKVIESGLKESPTTQYIQSHTNDNKPTTTQIRSETPTFNSSKKQLFTCFDNESWILISSPNSTFSQTVLRLRHLLLCLFLCLNRLLCIVSCFCSVVFGSCLWRLQVTWIWNKFFKSWSRKASNLKRLTMMPSKRRVGPYLLWKRKKTRLICWRRRDRN